MDYPSAGARHWAETGETAAEPVNEEAGIPEVDLNDVRLMAVETLHTSPGFRPSDAARAAVRRYRAIHGC